MYLLYVDESGDPGLSQSPTGHFILSGLVIHELSWRQTLERLIDFRRRMRLKFGLKLREELHSAHLITSPGELVRIPRNDRLTIIRNFADEVASVPDISLIHVVVDKAGKPLDYPVFEMAWKALIQRFENTMSYRNFPGPANPDERGMIFPDATDVKKLTRLLRKMRAHNPIPNQTGIGYRNLQLTRVIEDPNFRDSSQSYFIQVVDMSAYLLYQFLKPNAYFRKKGASKYFQRLDAVLCRVASPRDPNGIVWL